MFHGTQIWVSLLVAPIIGSPNPGHGEQETGALTVQQIRKLSVEECRIEFRELLKEDLPYHEYLKAIIDACDEQHENAPVARKPYFYHIYRRMVALLHGKLGTSETFSGGYNELSYVSSYLIKLDLSSESATFHAEVFQSDLFKNSDSEYHTTVEDLIECFTRSGVQKPYGLLIRLNFPGTRMRLSETYSSSSDWTAWLAIGEAYVSVGEYHSAIRWFSMVPLMGLGELRVADAYFDWGECDEAERRYRAILPKVDDWIVYKEQYVMFISLLVPLHSETRESLLQHINARLEDIEGSQP